jgi:predicted N-acyltransferase
MVIGLKALYIKNIGRGCSTGRGADPGKRRARARHKPASRPRVEICFRTDLRRYPEWQQAFARERKDHRYYEIVEDTIHQGFQYRYLLINDDTGRVCAVQPCFLLDQDLLAGIDPRLRAAVAVIRRLWPRFLVMRTLMVGCAAGEGHIDSGDETSMRRHAGILASELQNCARGLSAKLIVLKEFPASCRNSLQAFGDNGFTRLPSLPLVRLNIAYGSFEEYLNTTLGANTRGKLRKKFRAAARGPAIEMSLVEDISAVIDDVYRLYLQVFERSKLRFEKLSKDYLLSLGRRMPDKMRFFAWRREGAIVAFAMCMVHDDTVYFEYLGLDYGIAFDVHLYHRVMRDLITWAMASGYKSCVSTGGNYDPKYHLRFALDPLDLYVRHTSGIVNFILKLALPLATPIRCDPTLMLFPNYAELWGSPEPGRRWRWIDERGARGAPTGSGLRIPGSGR